MRNEKGSVSFLMCSFIVVRDSAQNIPIPIRIKQFLKHSLKNCFYSSKMVCNSVNALHQKNVININYDWDEPRLH